MGELPVEELKALVRLWRSEAKNKPPYNRYADGYLDGLTDCATDLETILKKAGHTL